MSTTTLTDTNQYCTFWADGLYFGVPVKDVQEVLRFQPMSAAPRAPKAVFGLINLRGQIVTAVDLRHRLRLSERPEGQSPMNVVVRSRGEVVSLLVDDIGDVIDTDGVALETVPPTVPDSVREVVTGVVPLQHSIVLVIDPELAADVSAARAS
jgi:purine-binding chemotaxis protein CheW